MRLFVVSLACIAAAAVPAGAAAATRQVVVGGSASGTCLTPATACSLPYALSVAADGDRVVVAPGTYTVGSGVPAITKDIVLEGDPAQARPVILGTAAAPGDWTLFVAASAGPRPVLRHLDIRQSGTGGYALVFGAVTFGTGEDLLVSSASPETARLSGTVLLRDSVLRAAPGGRALTVGSGGDTNAQLRNVTAAGGETGLAAVGDLFSPSGSVTTIRNSILLGTAEGIRATGLSGKPAVVLVDHSSFGTPMILPFGSIDQSGGGNVAAPLLVDLPGGDLREAAGSPTIDAGVADTFTGPRDPDGRPRALGAAPDIGAYEFASQAPSPEPPGEPTPTVDRTPPTITLSRLPARTTVPGLRTGILVGVTTDEPATLKASLTARRGRTGRLAAKRKAPVTVTLGRASAPLGVGARTLKLRTGPKVGRSTRFKATVTVTATDIAGNTARVSKTIAIGTGPGRR